MQGAFSRGSFLDRRRAGRFGHAPVAGGVLPCKEPSAGEASSTADAQGSSGIAPRRRRRASMQGAFSRGSFLDRRRAGKFGHCPPSPEACFHARSLQPGKLPRPPTRGEVRACPRRRRRASMQGAFSRGSFLDRRRAGRFGHAPVAGGVLPCKEPSAGEASSTADAQGGSGMPPSPEACFHARSLQPGKLPRPPTRREVPAIPPSPEACFHASHCRPVLLLAEFVA